MPDPVDPTTRRCDVCGETYGPGPLSEKHSNCVATAAGPVRATDKTIAVTYSPTAGPDTDSETPVEVRRAAVDPKNLINQYTLVEQIGKGGMGSVWKAYDRTLSRWVAIKFLLSTDEDGMQRFQREARLAARLVHPNIAPIFEVGQGRDRHFIAMEYVDGVTLDRLELPLIDMIDVFIKVCAGVEAAHKGGVVHRDLKPQNVMVSHQDRWPYVMDFGLAKALQQESSLSGSGTILGTPAYMSPEQAGGKVDRIDARSDVYSLGATLYMLLTHRAPFSGQSAMDIVMKVCNEKVVPPRDISPDIPIPLENIVLKAMAKDPADRYPSAADLGADLRRFLGGGQTSIIARSKSGPVGLLLLLLILIGVAMTGFYAMRSNPNAVIETPSPSALVAATSTPTPTPDPPPTPAPTPAPTPTFIPSETPSPSPSSRGTFSLKISIPPLAVIEKVTLDGKALKVEWIDGNLGKMDGLEIGDYEIVLRHPGQERTVVKIASGDLEHGRTYLLSGPFGALKVRPYR